MCIKSLLALFLFATTSAISFGQKGVFTTEKSKLIDAEGQTFVIRGMNNPHAWFREKAFLALDDIKATGSNTIRIVWNTKGNDSDLERIIRRCIDLEMIPMVELHDVTGNTSGERLAEMAEWYAEPKRREMLLKYEKFLLFNIANEWGDHKTKAEYWMSSYTRCIDIMRKAGYNTTLVIDAPGWGQNIEPIIECGQQVIDSDPLHNILFSIHMYGSWNKPERIKEKLYLCSQKGLPIIVGEFGYNFDNGKNNLTCKVDHTVILDVCNKLEYGFMPWSWTGNNKENQWLDLVEPSDWKTLTWWGQQVISGKGGITETAKKASVFK
ncbi:MAG: glycoside hydrolase family 5 protein [Bacteroidaceae bacterium]|nr:glycoside hydrolase family 5 protein [Bacteroidaceae bacterium]